MFGPAEKAFAGPDSPPLLDRQYRIELTACIHWIWTSCSDLEWHFTAEGHLLTYCLFSSQGCSMFFITERHEGDKEG